MRYVSIFLIMLLLVLSNCDSPSSTPDGEIINVTALEGKRFVAYLSVDRFEKPDTVTFEWDFTGISANDMVVEATIDAGTSWISLTELVIVDGNHATVQWAPGSDATRFGYFGEKNCTIRISVPSASISEESDPFIIIGALPVILDSPTGGETFSVNENIVVTYRTNRDLSTQFLFFFKNESMGEDGWEEHIDENSSRTSDPPLNTYTLHFSPLDYGDMIAGHLDEPIRFMLKDYSSPLATATIISGDIMLEQVN